MVVWWQGGSLVGSPLSLVNCLFYRLNIKLIQDNNAKQNTPGLEPGLARPLAATGHLRTDAARLSSCWKTDVIWV